MPPDPRTHYRLREMQEPVIGWLHPTHRRLVIAQLPGKYWRVRNLTGKLNPQRSGTLTLNLEPHGIELAFGW
jgi:hypothetical protein